MPVFEDECAPCGLVSSHVVMGSSGRRERRECPECGSTRLRRGMSSFGGVESEARRLVTFEAPKPSDDSYYLDSRNVGLWAKKRAKEMGVDLGSKFEATVEKARSGKLIKEMT